MVGSDGMSSFNGAVTEVEGRKCGWVNEERGGGVARLNRGSSDGSAPRCGRWAVAGMAWRWGKGGGEVDQCGEEESGRGCDTLIFKKI
jgi:hypothetical protein